MNKKTLFYNLLKIGVSFFFLYIIFKKIDLYEIGKTVKNSNLPLLLFSYFLIFILNFLLAFRFKLILEIYFKKKINTFFVFNLTMIGLFFNNFLPSGAGGDIAKVFYLIKDESKKFLLGISVIIDRYIGALTVMSMGTISVLFFHRFDNRIYFLIIFFFFFLIFFFFFLSHRKLASFSYNLIKRILPGFINEKLLNLYNGFNFYFTEDKKKLVNSIFLSFLLQIFSIFSQYIICFSVTGKFLNIGLFFILIPLIWASTLIPSIGGLGIREFSYIYLFTPYIGEKNASALSLLILFSIFLNSIIGGIIFVFFKGKKFNS